MRVADPPGEQRWRQATPALILFGAFVVAMTVRAPLARRVFAAMVGELNVPVTMHVTGIVVAVGLGCMFLATGIYGGWRHRQAILGRGAAELRVGLLGRLTSLSVELLAALVQPVLTAAVPLLPALGLARLLSTRPNRWATAAPLFLLAAVAPVLLRWVSRMTRNISAMTASRTELPSTRWRVLCAVGLAFITVGSVLARGLPSAVACPAQAFVPGEVDVPAKLIIEAQGTSARASATAVNVGGTLVSFVVDTSGRPEPRTIGSFVPGTAATPADVRRRVESLTFQAARKEDCPVRQLVMLPPP